MENRKLYWRIVTWGGLYAPKTIFASRVEAERKLRQLEDQRTQRGMSTLQHERVGAYTEGVSCNIRGYFTRKAAMNADASDDRGYTR